MQAAVLALALALAAPAVHAQDQALAWSTVRKHIEADWKKGYPTEKILKIEQHGPVQYYSSERASTDQLRAAGSIQKRSRLLVRSARSTSGVP